MSNSRCFSLSVLCLAGFSLGGLLLGAAEEPVPGDRQVVIETSLGVLIVDLYPGAAPQHVAKFLQRVDSNFYNGTTFHRAIPLAIIQGGDPLSTDPQKRDQYGTGGLMELKREQSPVSHLRGTLSAVLVPGNPDSGGSQFFVCVTDQVQLDGQYTAFGRVVEGMEIVEKISQSPADEQGRIKDRIELVKVYSRARPAPEPVPFVDTSVEDLARHKASIQTSAGEIEISLYPAKAPEHVRQFLRFAQLGLYDGTSFHRVVPGFVLQGGFLANRQPAVPDKYRKLLQPLKGEFNDVQHVRGTVSMARSEDPNSGMDSFFIVLDRQEELDGQYTAFGYVSRGLDVVDVIVKRPVEGETPVEPIVLRITVVSTSPNGDE